MGISGGLERLQGLLESMNARHAGNGAGTETASDAPPDVPTPGPAPAAPVDVAPPHAPVDVPTDNQAAAVPVDVAGGEAPVDARAADEPVDGSTPEAPVDVPSADAPAAAGAAAAPATVERPDDEELLPGWVKEPQPLRAQDLVGLETATGVVESLGLGFHLGAAVERIVTAAEQGRDGVVPLRQAAWLIERYVALVEQRPIGADLHASSARLARTGESIAGLKMLAEALAAGERDEAPPPPPDRALEPSPATPAPTAEPAPQPHPSFGRELALIAARWLVIVISLIVAVLAVTLIGEWR